MDKGRVQRPIHFRMRARIVRSRVARVLSIRGVFAVSRSFVKCRACAADLPRIARTSSARMSQVAITGDLVAAPQPLRGHLLARRARRAEAKHPHLTSSVPGLGPFALDHRRCRTEASANTPMLAPELIGIRSDSRL